jgi:hypothetical protein
MVVMLALAGCMVTPVMKFGEGKTARQAQHDVLVDYLPERLAIEGAWKGPVKDVRVRVYADADYRAQNLKWQQTFEQQLDYANAVLASHFGIRMQPEYKTWERHAAEVPLEDSLAVLAQLDPGSDVFVVIGLASSLTLVEASFEKLGVARIGGRHLIVRGFANLEERKAFAAAFPDLSSDERENAHETRKRHKNATVLLHEIAHAVGIPHEEIAKALMAPVYSHHVSDFSPGMTAMMLRLIDQRVGRAPSPGAANDAMLAAASGGATVTPAAATVAHAKVTVQITQAGDAVVDGTATENMQLSSMFKELGARDALTEIIIQKHRKAPSTTITNIMELAKQAGLSKFTVTIY